MPMGTVKGTTNCQVCIDCEPMFNIYTCESSFRCYGEMLTAPVKKDVPENEGGLPPSVAPDWCPNRRRATQSSQTERKESDGKEAIINT